MSKTNVVLVWFCLCLTVNSANGDNLKLWQKIVNGCKKGNSFMSCLANKTEKVLDRLSDRDVPLFDGMVFKRNNEIIESRRSLSLRDAVLKFFDTHTLTLDLTEPRSSRDSDKESSSSLGGFGKVNKKDKKYLYYALTAIAGIFGLSVPFVLKGLALLAGKALLASKAALIIIGSVALKKIFQSEKEPVNVHTHTVTLDDHDRMSALNSYPYHSYAPY